MTDAMESFTPLHLPDGTYMTQIKCHYEQVWAIDQDHNIWTWGTHWGRTEEDK